jgi:hypothetical protein
LNTWLSLVVVLVAGTQTQPEVVVVVQAALEPEQD